MQEQGAIQTVTIDSETIGARIRDALINEEDLIAVYLFGSQAEDKAHYLSDVDVAVLFDDQMSAEQLFQRTLAIGSLLEQALQCTVDVIPLNRAGPLLRFQVIQKGQLLLERDRTRRCLFHMRAMNAYYDAKPYLDYQRSEAIRRIREKGLGHGYQGHRNALAEARRLRQNFIGQGGVEIRCDPDLPPGAARHAAHGLRHEGYQARNGFPSAGDDHLLATADADQQP